MEDEENNKTGFWIVIIFILFTLIITLAISCINLKHSIKIQQAKYNNSTYINDVTDNK